MYYDILRIVEEVTGVTAKKLSTALSHWKDNMLVKAGIINFLNKQ